MTTTKVTMYTVQSFSIAIGRN